MSEAQIYDSAMAGYRSALITAQAEYQQAQINDEVGEAAAASMKIAAIEAEMSQYHNMASRHAQSVRAQQTAQQRSRYGLSPDEQEIARKSFSTGVPRDLTPEQREDFMERSYAEKKHKLHSMRASGEYRRTTEQTG